MEVRWQFHEIPLPHKKRAALIVRYLACFNVVSGDVEDAPAPNALNKYDISEKDGAFYVQADEASLKAWGREPVKTCKVAGNDNVVVVGGYAYTNISPKDGIIVTNAELL